MSPSPGSRSVSMDEASSEDERPTQKALAPHHLQVKNLKRKRTTLDNPTGQRQMFPGLTRSLELGSTAPDCEDGVVVDSDVEVEDETDALAYLRSVRHEASAIPALLVATKVGPQLPRSYSQPDHMCHSATDPDGYYQDGAYTARAEDKAPDEESQPDLLSDPNALYHEALLARFTSLRSLLHLPPSPALIKSMHTRYPNRLHETTVAPARHRDKKSVAAKAQWLHRLRTTDPLPVQLAAMRRRCVLALLGLLLNDGFLRSGRELRERTSRWIWGLLARLPDAGEMSHEEVAELREVGKRAVAMVYRLQRRAEMHEDGDGEEEDEDGLGWLERAAGEEDGREEDCVNGEPGEDEVEIDGEVEETPFHLCEAKCRLLARLDEASTTNASPTREPSSPSNQDATRPPSQPHNPDATGPSDVGKEEGEFDGDDSPKANTRALVDAPHNSQAETDVEHARANTRATLDLIITVVGRLYGQTDLLEFQDPWVGMS